MTDKLAEYFNTLDVPFSPSEFDFSQPVVASRIPLRQCLGDDWQWLPGSSLNSPVKTELASIKHIIAIASGKGGVGKSTTTVNVARALAAMGAKVGVLDADIYGPSVPLMLNRSGQQPATHDGKIMQPIESVEGIKANSIGFLVADTDAAVWRGPMASKAFMQLFNETQWGELDYLLIDLPPGTGDIQLTLAQNIPLSGAVIVSTPQDIALIDAQKAHKMFDKVNIDSLGLIENMSIFVCGECGHESALFGHEGAKQYAQASSIPYLGALPLSVDIRQYMDDSEEQSLTQKNFSHFYEAVALRLAIQLSGKAKQNYDKQQLQIPIQQLQ
ncbi:Mrp/NBP35 family ATP-binding protein [Saccharobesus litoralis]|nr:Mrp/NBP35 family ATP-binding protein [Saccharobesus litoralis]